jgi:hypothetical protein
MAIEKRVALPAPLAAMIVVGVGTERARGLAEKHWNVNMASRRIDAARRNELINQIYEEVAMDEVTPSRDKKDHAETRNPRKFHDICSQQ